MNSIRQNFPFYISFYEAAEEMTASQRGDFYHAIMRYMFEGEETELKGIAKAVFLSVKPLLNKQQAQYKNGQKRGKNASQSQANSEPTLSQSQANSKPKSSQLEPNSISISISISINKILDICKEESTVLYARHLADGVADYRLGQILDELSDTVSEEKVREIIRHANKTYIVQPKYSQLDLVWVLNNWQKVLDTKVENSPQGAKAEPVEQWGTVL